MDLVRVSSFMSGSLYIFWSGICDMPEGVVMLLKCFKYYVVKVYYHFYALDNRRLLITYYSLLITYASFIIIIALFVAFLPFVYINFECINNIIETMVGIAFLFRELYVAPTKLFPMWISVYYYMLVHMWSNSPYTDLLLVYYFCFKMLPLLFISRYLYCFVWD